MTQTYLDYSPKLSVNSAAVERLRLLSAKEAAKILSVNPNTVYNLWNRGLLDYWCIHRTKKTNLNAIEAFLERTKNMEVAK